MTSEEIQAWFVELLERLPSITIHRVDTGGIAVGGVDAQTGQSWNNYTPFLVNRYDEVEARAWAMDAASALAVAFPHESYPVRQEWNRVLKHSGSSIDSHFESLIGIFRGAASQVKAGRFASRGNVASARVRPLKYEALADLILRGLHEDGKIANIWEIAQSVGVEDFDQVTQVSEELAREGLIAQFASYSEAVWGRISAKGARLIEGIGKEESVMERFAAISNSGSLHIHGDVVDTNLAFLSPGANQNNGRGSTFVPILDAMIITLKSDGTLLENQRQDALADVAGLKLQLDKSTPTKTVVQSFLDNLGTIGSIGALLSELVKAWNSNG